MLHHDFLNFVLTEDELAMLLYIVNNLEPLTFGLSHDINSLCWHRVDHLRNLADKYKDQVKEEYLPIWQSLRNKLN